MKRNNAAKLERAKLFVEQIKQISTDRHAEAQRELERKEDTRTKRKLIYVAAIIIIILMEIIFFLLTK
ncbi:MAG: hypothetical protein JKX97_05870 [Candidatus Lindowbacteria bacterium]|nr:hypothetical protein [Candidatus Lindowbacteria bacterium]